MPNPNPSTESPERKYLNARIDLPTIATEKSPIWNSFSKQQQTVYQLVVHEGDTYRTAAKKLGCHNSNIWSIMKRCRRKLTELGVLK